MTLNYYIKFADGSRSSKVTFNEYCEVLVNSYRHNFFVRESRNKYSKTLSISMTRHKYFFIYEED